MTEPALENVVPGEAAEGRRGWPRRRGRLRGDLRASTIDGAAFSVMVGVGEWYMPLFVLAAGLGQVLSGLVVTLPSLIGAVLQLASPWGARVMGGVRGWTVLSAAVQAAAWAPLAVGAAVGWIPAWLVLASMVLYQAGGLAAGATWTTWIGQLVPSRIRSRYFGRRAWWCHMGTVGGVVAGGLILEAGVGTSGHTGPSARALAEGIVWFAALFAIAGVMRGVSAYYLWRQTGTGPVHGVHVHVAPTDLLRRLRHGRDGRLIASMMLMMGGAMVANAFFPAFLRDALGFSYAQIMALLATSVLAKAFTQPLWGEVAHRGGGAGADRVLLLGGLLVVPLPALWLVAGSMPSGGFWWMLATQVLAGAAWSAWDLATLLLALRVVRDEERTSLWAQYNLLNAGWCFLGSLVGAAVLSRVTLPGSWAEAWPLGGVAGGFAAAFALSVLCRGAVVAWVAKDRVRAHAAAEIAD